MGGWVTCMSYAASARVGDHGTLYAADAAAAIVKINPCIVDGPNVWKESSQIQWKVTGTARDPKLTTPLAFRSVLYSVVMPCQIFFLEMWGWSLSGSRPLTAVFFLNCVVICCVHCFALSTDYCQACFSCCVPSSPVCQKGLQAVKAVQYLQAGTATQKHSSRDRPC